MNEKNITEILTNVASHLLSASEIIMPYNSLVGKSLLFQAKAMMMDFYNPECKTKKIELSDDDKAELDELLKELNDD